MTRGRDWCLLLSGPNLEPAGRARARGLRHRDPRRPRGCGRGPPPRASGSSLEHVQSNHEGDLVEAIHGARGRAVAIIVNAGALTHTSWSLHDALAAYDGVVVELHLSNPAAREPFRHTSTIASVADGCIAGFGGLGYPLAVEAVSRILTAPVVSGRRRLTADDTAGPLAPLSVAGRLDRVRAALADRGW